MNPLYNSGGNGNIPTQFQDGINAARNFMNTVQNPTQMLLNDPRVRQALNLCRGSTLEQKFYNLCAERGIDPQAFLRELQRK